TRQASFGVCLGTGGDRRRRLRGNSATRLMGQREFRGLEIYSPIDAGVSVGRGQNKVSGEDYFSGLAVLLPFGRFRFGWRVWHEESIDRETESPSLRTRLRPWLYHLFVAVAVVFVVWFVD